jgi:hypothetical protein
LQAILPANTGGTASRYQKNRALTEILHRSIIEGVRRDLETRLIQFDFNVLGPNARKNIPDVLLQEKTRACVADSILVKPSAHRTTQCISRHATPWLYIVGLLLLGGPLVPIANAQQDTSEVWPEADVYVKLNNDIRVYLMSARAKNREEESGTWEFGPNLDIYLKSIRGRVATSANQERRKYLMVRFGYRAVTFPDRTVEQRGVIEFHARYYLPKSLMVVDRNRFDLRGTKTFSWRYRNRVSLEREFKARNVAFIPYVRAEGYYDCTAVKWTRFAYIGGIVFPFGSHFEIEPSYERQNNKTGQPAYTNGYGLTLSLYF